MYPEENTNVVMASQLRVPPQNIDAEQAFLGSILLRPSAITDVADELAVEAFYVKNHQTLYRAMLDLHFENKPIDTLTIGNKLEATNDFAKIGGNNFLLDLTNAVPTSTNAEYYAKVVEEAYVKRCLLQACESIKSSVFSSAEDSSSLVEVAEKSILEIGSLSHEQLETNEVQNKNYIEDYEYWQINKDNVLKTGMSVDSKVVGFRPGNFVVIGARPSVGKTMFALNLATNFSRNNNNGLFFSLEMGYGELIERVVSSRERVRYGEIRSLEVPAYEMRRYIGRAKQYLNLDVVDSPRQTINFIRKVARRIKKKKEKEGEKLDYIMIDYLQLMSSHDRKKSPFDIVSEVSKELKQLAKELQITIIALSQLNRENAREGKRPGLHNLRQSGDIEQDADIVMFLHREKDANTGDFGSNVELIVAKNRSGKTGIINMYVDGAYQSILDYE